MFPEIINDSATPSKSVGRDLIV